MLRTPRWSVFLASVLFATACGGPAPVPPAKSLELNDVSFLYPLPDWNHRDQLLSLDTAGPNGPLLPRSYYDQVLPIMTGESLSDTHDRLRIVAVRVDPCFPATAPPAVPGCLHQLRLVAQPIISHAQLASLGDDDLAVDDATLHLFYTLDDAHWSRLVDDLYTLKLLAEDRTTGPLAVHPAMKSEGLDGAYASRLKQLILDYASEQTLSRVAEMNLQAFFDTDTRVGAAWTFIIYDKVGTALVPADVARLSNQTSQGFTETGASDSRQGSLAPAPLDDDFVTLLTTVDTGEADDGTLKSAFKAALTFENPDLSTPRTVDCASCHAASRARVAAETQRDIDTSHFTERFTSSDYDLRRVDDTPTEPHTLRAFGYFFQKTALSQRVINDSAVTAAALAR